MNRRNPALSSFIRLCLLLLLAASISATASSSENIDLRPHMTEVKNQGNYRGTCSAFAATALMEFLLKQKTGQEFDLSENYVYWAGKHLACNTDYLRSQYNDIDGLAGYLAMTALQYGVMQEADWTYTEKNGYQSGDPLCKNPISQNVLSCFTGTPPKEAPVLPYYARPIFIEREKIAAFLLERKTPVALNLLWIYTLTNRDGDFQRLPNKEEVKQCLKPDASCGHVILLVGYDTTSKRFIFRNSWGTNWGRQGYGTLPEEYVINFCETCPYLSKLPHFDTETRNFLKKTSLGISAELF